MSQENVLNEYILSVRDLVVSYPAKRLSFGRKQEKKVLDGVTFQMKEGEILGLAGESGCGKTTIARTLLHIVNPQSGSIDCKVDKVQMVFQDPYSSLNPAKTISWILQEPLKLNTKDDAETRLKKVKDMVEQVGLDPSVLDKKPSELSGGMRQRVCIGLALMQNPKLLIADEPVSALDVTIQAQILELLRDIQKKNNISILFISHDLRTMYHFCDRILIMREGKIIEQGVPEVMYREPKEDYTKLLLASADLGNLSGGSG
ncbi:MAG: ATP-binding cassette domain-containing protein [Lachnospiraceae bacterium]|nr:ATP-binding cassette domain-containing protein [Lachnospiraceae bacterium]